MIFVTVGTHEQQFNRLIKEVDNLVKKKYITEKVFIQIGYSDYIPQNCEYTQFLKYDEMSKFIKEARIVITHGGPASFLSVLEINKTPIIVPRKEEYGEHVNNHQQEFVAKLNKFGYELVVVKNIKNLVKSRLLCKMLYNVFTISTYQN
ncbi:glycosyltransferase [Enterococcus casseliflavus]|uniref:glycosyltransferase n=1 Tax=Enterococcus casseliflavus TaxID=37734 RepID=UPI0035CBE7D2